ncbi:uncharacterized protein LOC127093761 [Lathyrus oleraceus]|uniref:uncharacterized protein LOC127093761 n=1 Tax=Pisum sativum TaxID=3888 RepID=UPI0021D137F3|nr:uncharacterized protein LOC127093761 [Pisum sativum]
MLKAINSIVVTLIPKTNQASMVKDYRLISCCTTMHKIISRIITTKLSKVLGSIINESQAAFVLGKHIQDHILLANELIEGYNINGGPPRCMFQMDLLKAYDTLGWCALEDILKEFSFPDKFIRWIMVTMITVSYRFKINGETTNILKAIRDLFYLKL